MIKIFRTVGLILVVGSFGFTFIAYFVSSYNPTTGVFYDGLGRMLTDSPWFMKWIFAEGKLWAGWKWFFLDMVSFWVAIGTGMYLLTFTVKRNED